MRERELRLALICYGGVSLAVYMYGITREIWTLARASRGYHDGTAPHDETEAAYRALFEEVAATVGVRLRCVVDIVAGSSAGGINGIFLADAIASGRSLEPLRDLWLDKADVDELLDPDARPISAFTKFWARPLVWAMLRRRDGTIAQTVAPATRAEVARKLSRFVRARWFAPPFGGRVFTGLMLDALAAMAAAPRGPTLLPEGLPLDLFVTMTDFHGHPQTLRLHSPPQVAENEHRVSVAFSTRGRTADLDEVPALAFAARATASFPGAFPPFRVDELDAVLAERGLAWPGRDAFLARALPQRAAAGTVANAVLIDGSVLANAPFGQAIRALRNRPARREIDRRFVYIDPIPGNDAFQFGLAGHADGGVPGFFATIVGASSTIPREQPIRDSLEAIEARSTRARQMRGVTASLQVEVEQQVEAMLGRTLMLAWPTPRRMASWREKAQERAARAAGFAYAAYGHLKLAGIVDDLVATARRLDPAANDARRMAMREAIERALVARGLDMIGQRGGGATAEAVAFFRAFDLRYRIRRLRALARRLADDIDHGEVERGPAADAVHDAIFAALALYLERETAEWLGSGLPPLAAALTDDPDAFLDALGERRGLVAADAEADAMLCRAIVQLPARPQRSLILAYLGFPLYDIATLPLLQGEGLDEFDPVKVDRISPEDATSIRSGTAATLRGTEFNNFGAFFSRAYRENDYLWGRLHGAERMVDILLSTLGPAEQPPPARVVFLKKRLFTAILDAETRRLSASGDLIATLRREIEAL